MRIIKLTANNFKRLKAIDITPEGDVVILSGKNGQGKTSVLDAIWQALGGGHAAKGTPMPVRDGEDQAVVTLDLGDIVVTRTWKSDGKTSLVVANGDGAKYGSPQAMLDGLVGRLCFDPHEFSRLAPKAQLAQLLDLVELPFDVDAMAAQRKAIFDQRTDVNRDAKAARARLAAMPAPAADLPLEEVSAADVLARAAEARAIVDATAAARRAWEAATFAADRAGENVQRIRDELETAEAAFKACSAEQVATYNALQARPADPDLGGFTEQLAALEQTNAAVRAAQARATLENEAEQLEVDAAKLTGKLDQLDADKSAALAAAEMPIAGLAFDDEGVTFKGMPFSQCSAAEQLRVSVAMAIALNPEGRVIRITDGSLLDSDSMGIISEMAGAHDFQVWVEVVDESGELGVVIEDGAVVGAVAVVA